MVFLCFSSSSFFFIFVSMVHQSTRQHSHGHRAMKAVSIIEIAHFLGNRDCTGRHICVYNLYTNYVVVVYNSVSNYS